LSRRAPSLHRIPSIAKPTKAPAPHFSVVEADIASMQNAMAQGRITSRELVLQYLTRIAYYEDSLNAAITINRHALQEAEALDLERARGKGTRAAARHSDRAQRQYSYNGYADHRRRARIRWPRAAIRGDADSKSTRRGCCHHRENDDDRARELDGDRSHANAR
jgi:hypothetical protein